MKKILFSLMSFLLLTSCILTSRHHIYFNEVQKEALEINDGHTLMFANDTSIYIQIVTANDSIISFYPNGSDTLKTINIIEIDSLYYSGYVYPLNLAVFSPVIFATVGFVTTEGDVVEKILPTLLMGGLGYLGTLLFIYAPYPIGTAGNRLYIIDKRRERTTLR